MAEQPFITTQVLNTSTGNPAWQIKCGLQAYNCLGYKGPSWHATTDCDGRITDWHTENNGIALNTYVRDWKASATLDESLKFKPRFNTSGLFGGNDGFYWDVTVAVRMRRDDEHYCVLLSMGPWGYSTCRGA
ncbi:hypothetical protein LTR09_013000 [Extremus antarcticus]|uniref:Transthyretin/hydroxyisourate hydrolase domain-containing protein n=1 Tax=Extremus antarcticus TaxID=702011 RepID=A0AAJ0D9E5_9PEZI|nr:hypothetical protein LTR09_013000 [Extremus antarcticus]